MADAAASLQRLVPAGLLEELIGICRDGGADFAEIYVERAAGHSFSLQERSIRSASYALSLGVGVRAIAGSEVGYASCDALEPGPLRAAARAAASVARSGGSGGRGAVPPLHFAGGGQPDCYPVDVVPDAVAPAAKAALLMRGDVTGHAYDPRIRQVTGAFVDQTKDILVATSEGTLAEDRQVMCRMSFTAIAEAGGERRTGFDGGGGRVSLGHFDGAPPEAMAREAARMAVAQLGAREAPAGEQTVVLSPGWSGILLHEAVGHGLEADFIRKGTSLFAGKLGQRVASELCTVVDTALLPHRRGSLNIDDEGHVGREKVLIERGILRGYLVDRLSAQIMGTERTGSGRRQSYRHPPMPRMTNTTMAAGPHAHGEIVASVKRGLYCAAFGGGQVDIANGNFVFEVREGYAIEDGRLTYPVRGATLIGVGPEALGRVSMVGDDPALDPGIGTCGKDGQSVPVGVGMPTVRMDGITVGGTRVGP